jgi:hypothetical protein
MATNSLKTRFNLILMNELRKRFSLSALELAPDFRSKQAPKGAGEATIAGQLYACEKTGNVRIGTNTLADSMHVEFGVIPPGEDYDFPIMGFDFVNTNKYLVAIIELHPLRKDEEYRRAYVDPMEETSSRYEHIPWIEGRGRRESDWSRPYRSGFGFYRWCEQSYLSQAEQAFRDYTALFCQFLKDAAPIGDPQRKAERDAYMQRWRKDFVENDPGSGPIRSMFGDEWGEAFMRDFVFK